MKSDDLVEDPRAYLEVYSLFLSSDVSLFQPYFMTYFYQFLDMSFWILKGVSEWIWFGHGQISDAYLGFEFRAADKEVKLNLNLKTVIAYTLRLYTHTDLNKNTQSSVPCNTYATFPWFSIITSK